MYKKEIAKLLSEIINKVSYENRNKSHLVMNIVSSIKPDNKKTKLCQIVSILKIEKLIFGECGELGLALFMDNNMKEVIRICFEDVEDDNNNVKIHGWIEDTK